MTLADRLLARRDERIRKQAGSEAAGKALAILQSEVSRLRMAAMPGSYGSWTRSSGGKYPGGTDTPLAGITFNHWQLRQQARDVVHDSVQAGAMVYRFADTVVDSGLTIEPEPKSDILGITPEAAQAWSAKVRESFDLWASSKSQNRSGSMSFYQAEHLYQVYSERDNDQFTRLFYNSDRALLNPLQFELLDTNQIRGDAITSSLIIGKFQDGIERDAMGRETLYHIWAQLADSTPGYQSIDIPRLSPSGLPNMLHGFRPDYAGQGRGLSSLGASLQEFQDLTTFTLAEIQKAINHASINLYVKPSQNAPASNPFESIGTMPAGPSSIIAGAPGSISGAGSAAVSTGPTVTYTPLEEAQFKQPGVGVFNLDSGEDLKAFDSSSPTAEFAAFVESFCTYLCARHGMPIEILTMKFSDNYSASRATLLLFWRVAQMKRDAMDADFVAPIYEAWLSLEIAAGRISCPGWQDPRLKAAWLGHRLNGQPMPNIDPNATAKADQLYIEMGAQTLDDVARNLNGSSGKANRAKLAAEFEELRAAGQVPWAPTGLGSPLNTEINPKNPQPATPPGAPGQPPKKPAPGGPPK